LNAISDESTSCDAVEQDRLDTDHGVAGEHADVHRVLEALVGRLDVLARDAATGDLVLELVRLVRRDLEGSSANWILAN
jgi:hypothetical protein